MPYAYGALVFGFPMLRNNGHIMPIEITFMDNGMVHAKVGQKLVNSNKLRVFLLSNDECGTLHLRLQLLQTQYKTTCSCLYMLVYPPQQIIYSF
jgi:hypothetical protein